MVKHYRTGEIYRWKGRMVYRLVNGKWRERPELKVADLFHWPYIPVKMGEA